MRKSFICPKCQGVRILLIERVPETGANVSDVRDMYVAVAGGPSWRPNRAGRLSAAVCRACGYTEFTTEAPDKIPVDGTLVKEVVGPAVGPYRG